MNAQGTGQRIVVVGGYGAVGRVVSLALADRHHGTVVVAGRDVVRARTLARRSPGPLAPTEVDAADAAGLARVLDGAGVLVMCADGANLDVARCCLERGVHYVDISASARVLGAIEALDPLARAHGAAAALSVGLAPGVTNLLARSCVDLRPVTGLVFAARAGGLLRPLRHPPVQDRILGVLPHLNIGSDRFAVTASARSPGGAQVTQAALGRGQSRATGLVAARVAQLLATGQAPPGVHHLDELVRRAEFLAQFAADQHGPQS